MFTSDEVFFKEFTEMMKYRKSYTEAKLSREGKYNQFAMLNSVMILPDGYTPIAFNTKEELYIKEDETPISLDNLKYACLNNFTLSSRDIKYLDRVYERIYVKDIEDEYFSALNNTEVLWVTKYQIKRRKFDYQGKYILDKNTGGYVLEDIDTPTDCVAIISNINVHVPNLYKNKNGETFMYADMITTEDSNETRYIYIIPKKYCHKMNETALVISLKQPKSFYSCFNISLIAGFYVSVAVVPYKITKPPQGLILNVKTTDDFNEDLKEIREFWVKNDVMFNPNECILHESIKNRDNMAYLEVPAPLEYVDSYDVEMTLDKNYEVPLNTENNSDGSTTGSSDFEGFE